MKKGETLFIEILVWAYNKGEDGFVWDEMRKKFNLSQAQDDWALVVFRQFNNELLSIAPYKKEHAYIITEKGIPLAINYLNLKEAEKTSKIAIFIAILSVVVSIIPTIWPALLWLWGLLSTLAELKF